MIPTEIQNLIRSQPERVLELRLLRGSAPWSLAGTDGMKRCENLAMRGELVSRISSALEPLGWSARLGMVTSANGRPNKIELLITGPDGAQEAWSW